MLGFNSKNVFQNELDELNTRATDIDFDIGDQLRASFYGLFGKDYSKEALLEGAAKIRNQKLADTYDPRATATASMLGPLQAQYQGVEGRTTKEIETAQAVDAARAKALQDVMASNPDFKIDELSPTASAGAIYGKGGKDAKAAAEAKETEARLRLEAKERALEKRLDTKEAIARQDRLQERADLLDLKRDELDFRRAEAMRADARLAQDRKDKAIAILMSGLGNLGEAFAGMTV
tara:strand:+ start:41 stop:745 length:705 start_codon:yes stop_codon:yes gene_type:complete